YTALPDASAKTRREGLRMPLIGKVPPPTKSTRPPAHIQLRRHPQCRTNAALVGILNDGGHAWDAPAPSLVISRSSRRSVGICSIAARSTSMMSLAVLDPAPPGRGINAASSRVLSIHTPRLWNPNVFLNVPSACCLP